MTGCLNLNLLIRRAAEGHLTAEVRVSTPDNAAPVVPLSAPVPLRIDQTHLMACAQDASAYGAALSAMVFASAELRASVTQARAVAAQHLHERGATNLLLDDLQPELLPSAGLQRGCRLLVGMTYGLMIGPVVGLGGWLGGGPITGLLLALIGLTYGLFSGLMTTRPHTRPILRYERLRWSSTHFRRRLPGNLLFGLIGGLAGGLASTLSTAISCVLAGTHSDPAVLSGRLAVGLVIGLVVGLTVALNDGLQTTNLTARTAPMQGIRASLHSGLLQMILSGLAVGLVVGLVVGLDGTGNRAFFSDMLGILTTGLIFGLAYGQDPEQGERLDCGIEAFLQHYILRAAMAYAGLFPLRPRTFLQAMSERLLIERDGPVFRFRHMLLQDFFAVLSDAEVLALLRGERLTSRDTDQHSQAQPAQGRVERSGVALAEQVEVIQQMVEVIEVAAGLPAGRERPDLIVGTVEALGEAAEQGGEGQVGLAVAVGDRWVDQRRHTVRPHQHIAAP